MNHSYGFHLEVRNGGSENLCFLPRPLLTQEKLCRGVSEVVLSTRGVTPISSGFFSETRFGFEDPFGTSF